jgi:DNA polymerase III delta subunit
MVILLYGPDSYRKQKNLNTIVKTYQEKHSVFSIEHFNLENEGDFLKLKDFCGQTSLFELKKLAVVKNATNLKKESSKEIKDFLKDNLKLENNIIILSEEEAPGKDFEFLLKDDVKSYEFKNLSGAHLEVFIKKEVAERKINLAPDAIALLVKVFSTKDGSASGGKDNTWGLVTELEKLELLSPEPVDHVSPKALAVAQGNKQQITAKDLENFLTYFEEPALFQFIDAVSKNKHFSQKIYNLENLILNKEDGAKIFNIFATRPFLNFETIKALADYDVLVKSGKLDYELALFDMILS